MTDKLAKTCFFIFFGLILIVLVGATYDLIQIKKLQYKFHWSHYPISVMSVPR